MITFTRLPNYYGSSTPRRRRSPTLFRLRKRGSPSPKFHGHADQVVSARQLAAGLWQATAVSKVVAAGCGGGGKTLNLKSESESLSCNVLDSEAVVWPLKFMSPPSGLTRKYGPEKKDHVQTSEFGSSMKPGTDHKHTKQAMEGAIKWDQVHQNSYEEVYHFSSPKKFREDQNVSVSVSSPVQAELTRARLRIQQLENEQRLFQKEIKSLLRMLGQQRALWQRRQRQKIHDIVYELRNELTLEKKICRRKDIVNYNLVNELADAKISLNKLKADYEQEKKAKELMEEICKEVVKKFAQDKAEVEALKTETIKMQEEMEEERRMLQIAEVWREELVQMKMTDAKLALEEKGCQMNRLIADLETFLASGTDILEETRLRKAEVMKQEAKSVNFEDMKEFSCMPRISSDEYSIFQELEHIEADEKVIEPRSKCSPTNSISNMQDDNSNVSSDNNGFVDEDRREWKCLSYGEGQGSSYSLEDGESSVIGPSESKTRRQSAKDCRTAGDEDSRNAQIKEDSSESGEQSLDKASSIDKLKGSGGLSYKLTLDNAGDGKVSDGKIIVPSTSSRQKKSWKGRPANLKLAREWSSQVLVNPHVARGKKGCMEWSQCIPKTLFKAKLMEARMESQRARLRGFVKTDSE